VLPPSGVPLEELEVVMSVELLLEINAPSPGSLMRDPSGFVLPPPPPPSPPSRVKEVVLLEAHAPVSTRIPNVGR
jgi:hypothetical protein